jgi:hypothetical protein
MFEALDARLGEIDICYYRNFPEEEPVKPAPSVEVQVVPASMALVAQAIAGLRSTQPPILPAKQLFLDWPSGAEGEELPTPEWAPYPTTVHPAHWTSGQVATVLRELGVTIPEGYKITGSDLFGDYREDEEYDVVRALIPEQPSAEGRSVGHEYKIFENDCASCWVIETPAGHEHLWKVMRCNWSQGEHIDFCQEAVIQAYLAHRYPGNVPQVHGIFEDNGRFIIAMDYLGNGTLEDAIKCGSFNGYPLELPHLLVLKKTAGLIGRMQNDVGFVHNDLVPRNLGLDTRRDSYMEPVPIDFGHTTLFDPVSGKTIGGGEFTLRFPSPPEGIEHLTPHTPFAVPSLTPAAAFAVQRLANMEGLTGRQYPNGHLKLSLPITLAEANDPAINPYVRAGDLMYLVYGVLKTLATCLADPATSHRATYLAMYQDLHSLFRTNQEVLVGMVVEQTKPDGTVTRTRRGKRQDMRHKVDRINTPESRARYFYEPLNLFDLINEIETKAGFTHLGYYATKVRAIQEALLPDATSRNQVLDRFLPENFQVIIQAYLDARR